MTSRSPRPGSGVTRRALLAGLTAGATGTSGCVTRLRTLANRQQPDPISLSVKCLPVDEDPYSIAIARQVAEWFGTAGIDTTVQPMTAEELYRQTLVNHEFDVFVGQYPSHTVRPDALYPLLHSRFSVEPGWQNPFGYTNLTVDDLLTEQRRTSGERRAEAVSEIQRHLVRECPFVVVGFPDVIRAASNERFTGWRSMAGLSPLHLLSLDRRDLSATTLRATTPDMRPTTNLNPLVASFRRSGSVTELIYDSLARRYRGDLHPWAAAEFEWTAENPPVVRATLREDQTWHDGEPLTADDVEFTYALLADTSLGSFDEPVPPLRFRGRASLVESATALDDRTVEIEFGECTPEVATRALTVPLLAEHVWEDRAARADVSGLNLGSATTEALVASAVPPVGSGPLEFESAAGRESLTLSRFEDHFLERPDQTQLPGPIAGGVPFEEFELRFVGSDASAVDLVANGEADFTSVGVGPDLVRTIGKQQHLTLAVDQTDSFYFLGFNARRTPLSNPRFRHLLSRLLDRKTVAESVFNDYVTPAVSPLAGTDWLPSDLAWDEDHPVTSFLGSGGSVNKLRAREAFRDAGYRYDERHRLLRV
ncbi:ABC transporter substrate-binding protein [Haloarcula limicola]|uniref:ABC transporter substrate-binding protein n=1 Tax=Haloarcula limicola TaxID=1429915 RepID=UPI001F50CFFF|nr:ABC transporter substrate-binding protein [Halomicroarcula limicola]